MPIHLTSAPKGAGAALAHMPGPCGRRAAGCKLLPRCQREPRRRRMVTQRGARAAATTGTAEAGHGEGEELAVDDNEVMTPALGPNSVVSVSRRSSLCRRSVHTTGRAGQDVVLGLGVGFATTPKRSVSPIPRLSTLWSDCKNSHQGSGQVVVNRVLEALLENAEVDPVLIFGPGVRVFLQVINLLQHLRAEGVREDGATLEVPEESLSKFCLCLRQNLNYESRHQPVIRAFASAQGTGFTAPDRRDSRRRNNSPCQASEITRSSPPSKLSSSAMATAERSSGGSSRTSSSKRSMRAFMIGSLALRYLPRVIRRETRSFKAANPKSRPQAASQFCAAVGAAATSGWSHGIAPMVLAPPGLPTALTASEKNSRLMAIKCVRFFGTSASS